MRKLIVILSVLLLSAGALTGQDREVERVMKPGQTILDYQGTDADTLGVASDTLSYVTWTNKNRPLYHNLQVETAPVDAIDGTVTIDVKVYGRVFSADSWSEVDVTNTGLDGTGTVTVNVYSDEAAAVDTTAANTTPYYRQYKIEITLNDTTGLDAGEKIQLQYAYWKFYER